MQRACPQREREQDEEPGAELQLRLDLRNDPVPRLAHESTPCRGRDGGVADDRKVALHEWRGIDEEAGIDVRAAGDLDAYAARRVGDIVDLERIIAAA
jgi:hypothetical protein